MNWYVVFHCSGVLCSEQDKRKQLCSNIITEKKHSTFIYLINGKTTASHSEEEYIHISFSVDERIEERHLWCVL